MGKTILELTIKKKWFDMIVSDEKPEEYRDIKEYWKKRLVGKLYSHVRFRNGYATNAPTHMREIRSIAIGNGNPYWGAAIGKKVFIIKLG